MFDQLRGGEEKRGEVTPLCKEATVNRWYFVMFVVSEVSHAQKKICVD